MFVSMSGSHTKTECNLSMKVWCDNLRLTDSGGEEERRIPLGRPVQLTDQDTDEHSEQHNDLSRQGSIIDSETLSATQYPRQSVSGSPKASRFSSMDAPRRPAAPTDLLAQREEDNLRSCALAGIRRWLDAITRTPRGQNEVWIKACRQTPTISAERQLASLADTPFELDQIAQMASRNQLSKKQTVLYLGYGSNMSAQTFRGKRNIQPISQMNVVVPEIALTFDLPGVPYSEPCFGNVRYRHPAEDKERRTSKSPYHKDLWAKGLVGIVYEVTEADFAHIIATEGGGAAYQDVLVDCYALDADPREQVPVEPHRTAFKAHTLFCPPNGFRPDPSYAQPSPRYIKLITDGAEEHRLPYEYQDYLKNIRTYTITTTMQRLGQFIFLAIWAPIFAFIFGGAGMFLDKNGKYPEWYAKFAMATFAACWGSYDNFFKKTFGDGERTIEKGEDPGQDEKEGLIRYQKRNYGAVASWSFTEHRDADM